MKTYPIIISIVTGLILFSTVNSPYYQIGEVGDPITLVTPPSFIVNSTIPINVVFLGFDESLIDLTYINDSITHWYTPTIWLPLQFAGSNLTLDINYHFSNFTTLEEDFITYLASIASIISPPPDLEDYDPTAIGAYLFSAVDTINWLDNHINNYFGNINDSYCFYLIDTYTWHYILDYYYYDININDPDTGKESSENLTICYGGEYPNRGVFLDLSAGPVNYEEKNTDESNEGVSSITIKPIWEYIFPQDTVSFNANITEYIQETIDLVFTPSYLYEPVIKDDYDVTVFILDNTSTSYIYNDPTSYIDPTKVTNALEALIPYSDWNTNYYVDILDNHATLQQIIKDAYTATDHDAYPYAIHPYQTIIDYLDIHRSEFLMSSETLPVFIFAWDETLFFDTLYTLGFAAADDNNNPLMVLCGYNPALYPNFGYTKIVIHEIGHILGLRHPHDGWSWDRYNDTGYSLFQDWLRDLISTPMTYAHQDTVFSTFDYDQLDRGHCYERLNDSWYLRYDANVSLLTKGYSEIDITMNTTLGWTLANHSKSLEAFETEDFETAFYYANLSYAAATEYFDYANSLITKTTTTTTTTTTTAITSATTTTTTTTTIKTTIGFTFFILASLSVISIVIIYRRSKL